MTRKQPTTTAVWKAVVDLPAFDVSDQGDVRRRSPLMAIRQTLTKNGYRRVSLSGCDRTVRIREVLS